MDLNFALYIGVISRAAYAFPKGNGPEIEVQSTSSLMF